LQTRHAGLSHAAFYVLRKRWIGMRRLYEGVAAVFILRATAAPFVLQRLCIAALLQNPRTGMRYFNRHFIVVQYCDSVPCMIQSNP
jgi:hypothetical protein